MAINISAYNLQSTRAADPVFIAKVAQAIITAAIQVQAELIDKPHHSERASLSIQVLSDPAKWSALMAQGVASNAAITDASLDSDIQFTVNANWNAYCVRG